MKRLCLCLMVIALMITACEIRTPVLPEWDVTLTVPLIHQQYFVSDLVDSVNIVTGDGDVLVLRGTGSAETPAFGEVGLTPGINGSDLPLFTGSQQQIKVPFSDSAGLVELSYGRFNSGVIRTKFQGIAAQVWMNSASPSPSSKLPPASPSRSPTVAVPAGRTTLWWIAASALWIPA